MRRLRTQGEPLSMHDQLQAPFDAPWPTFRPKRPLLRMGHFSNVAPTVSCGVSGQAARAPERNGGPPFPVPRSPLRFRPFCPILFDAVWAYRQNRPSQRDADASGASAAPQNVGVEPAFGSPPRSLFHQIHFCPILRWCLPPNLSHTSATHVSACRWSWLSHLNTSLLWPAGGAGSLI
jgi:hypothetical protein